jgi:WD40 repeat protein
MKLGEPQHIPTAVPGPVFAASFHPGGKTVAIGALAQESHSGISVLSFPEFTESTPFSSTRLQDDADSVEVLEYSPDGRFLAVAGLSGRLLELLPLDEGSPPPPVEGVSWVSFSSGTGSLLAVAGDSIRVTDIRNGDVVWQPHGTSDDPDGCLAALSTSGSHIAAIRPDGSGIDLIVLSTGSVDKTFTGGPSSLRWLGFTADDEFLIALDRYAESMTVWHLPEARPHLPDSFGELASYYWTAALHPDGKSCARGMISGVLDVVDLTSGAIADSSRVHKGRILDLTFSPDGTHLVSVGEDGDVLAWPVEEC